MLIYQLLLNVVSKLFKTGLFAGTYEKVGEGQVKNSICSPTRRETFSGGWEKKDQLVQISFENNAKTFWKDSW